MRPSADAQTPSSVVRASAVAGTPQGKWTRLMRKCRTTRQRPKCRTAWQRRALQWRALQWRMPLWLLASRSAHRGRSLSRRNARRLTFA